MLLVTELSNFTVNDFYARKSAQYNRVFVVTEFVVVVSEAQCNNSHCVISVDNSFDVFTCRIPMILHMSSVATHR